MNETLKSGKTLCQGIKVDGEPCQTFAQQGSEYCFFHDPARAEKRLAAQSSGGSQNRMKTLGAEAPDLKVKDTRDVVNLISQTINQVRKGQLDPRVANAIGYLANILIKAAEQSDLEGRLAELEALVKTRKNKSPEDLELTGGGS